MTKTTEQLGPHDDNSIESAKRDRSALNHVLVVDKATQLHLTAITVHVDRRRPLQALTSMVQRNATKVLLPFLRSPLDE